MAQVTLDAVSSGIFTLTVGSRSTTPPLTVRRAGGANTNMVLIYVDPSALEALGILIDLVELLGAISEVASSGANLCVRRVDDAIGTADATLFSDAGGGTLYWDAAWAPAVEVFSKSLNASARFRMQSVIDDAVGFFACAVMYISGTGTRECTIDDNPALQVRVTYRLPPTSAAGPDQEVGSGEAVQLAGQATSSGGAQWTTAGDGTFDDDTALDAIYTPGAADIAAGTVTLTLTVQGEADGGGGEFDPAVDAMTVTITVGGYKVFLTEDRAADPAVDTPIATLAPDELPQYAIPLASLLANKTYYISVCAYNATGNSAVISARLTTDGSADPHLRPTPVAKLTVTPLAGALADVRWEYDEVISVLRADEFAIEVLSLTGGAPVAVSDVSATEAREYAVRIGPGADGDYRVKVFSKLVDAYEPAVTGVDVRLDATAPVGTVPEIAVI